MHEVEITPEGLRHLDRLPEKVRTAVIETILGSIAENPRRAGKPLRGELEGLYSARRGEFRVIYETDEAEQVVVIHRVQASPRRVSRSLTSAGAPDPDGRRADRPAATHGPGHSPVKG